MIIDDINICLRETVIFLVTCVRQAPNIIQWRGLVMLLLMMKINLHFLQYCAKSLPSRVTVASHRRLLFTSILPYVIHFFHSSHPTYLKRLKHSINSTYHMLQCLKTVHLPKQAVCIVSVALIKKSSCVYMVVLAWIILVYMVELYFHGNQEQ
jgi:hypothetical protein